MSSLQIALFNTSTITHKEFASISSLQIALFESVYVSVLCVCVDVCLAVPASPYFHVGNTNISVVQSVLVVQTHTNRLSHFSFFLPANFLHFSFFLPANFLHLLFFPFLLLP